MHYIKRFAVALVLLSAELAHAQISPGGGMGPGMGGPAQPAGEEKKEGVAEAAPKTPGLLPTTPALPAQKSRRKRWKLLDLDGYFRLRTDWFKNFNEGFPDRPDLGGSPFPKSIGCTDTSTVHTDRSCDDSLASTNMRLRLEPTLNIDEGTSIHVQADVLDNLVLGSTPTGTDLSAGAYTNGTTPPIVPFGGTQTTPVKGVNSDRDSILIKRAWAEIAVPLGIIKVGRMPNHWGMGINENSGGYDPINGTYDYDGDYGDTVDRASFSMQIPGTNLRGMIAADYPATRLVSNQTLANKGNEGHPFDLDDSDDVKSYVAVLSRMDSPQEFRDTVDRGELALNYGVYFEYKTQAWDDNLSADFTGTGGTFNSLGQNYVPRGFKQYMPDLWGKLGIGAFTVEAEFVAQLGTIDHLDDYAIAGFTGSADIRRYGGVGRLTWRGLENKLHLGIESGFASGGQADHTPPGALNLAYANPLGALSATNHTITEFSFNREYKVDMILWRHLYGALTNAVYVKPFLQYDLTKSISFKIANITSFALRPVSTPGNARTYGTEFDSELGYNDGRIFAGISYGVLFPFAALNHPADVVGGTTYGFSTDASTGVTEIGDATTSHYIQLRLVLGF